jgi:fructosamine-3-kinase
VNPALLAVVTARLARAEPTLTRVPGGDINEAYEARWPGGERVFIKTRQGLTGDAYRTEAEGLRWLAEARALRVPKIVAQSEPGDAIAFLALEHMARSAPALDHDDTLGDGLAALHRAGAPGFGLAADNWIGSLPQSNRAHDTWAAFYAEERVLPLVKRAIDGGHAPASWATLAEQLAGRLPDLAGPPEPPARLHGDLWSGNVITDSRGQPVLIDPAVHGGHREVDLAMLALFGGLSPRVVAAYQARSPLAADWKARTRLWQIYPLLVHTVLFRGSYVDAAEAAMRAYL